MQIFIVQHSANEYQIWALVAEGEKTSPFEEI